MAIGKQLLNEFLDKAIGRKVKYSELRKILLEVNQRVKNSNAAVHDQNNQSFLANFRNLIGNSFNSLQTDDPEYLGIVIKVRAVDGREGNSDGLKTRYYIDVPLGDSGTSALKEPSLAKSDARFLNSVSQKIFYAESESVANNPPINSIARVKLSQNYLNNISNPLDNKYLGLYINGFVANPDSTAPEAKKNSLELASEKEKNIVAGANREKKEQVKQMYQAFKDEGFEDDIVYAILGNFYGESGWKVSAKLSNSYINSLSDAGSGGRIKKVLRENPENIPRGLAGFWGGDGSMVQDLAKFAKENGIRGNNGYDVFKDDTPNAFYVQARYVALQLRGDRGKFNETAAYDAMRGASTLEDKVKIFCNKYERPGTGECEKSFPNRMGGALAAKDIITGGPTILAAATPSAASPQAGTTTGIAANSQSGTVQSIPSSAGKLKLVLLETDMPTGIKKTLRLGSTRLKVREDIAYDINKIKDILNAFQIPLAVLPSDVRLDNKELSLLGRLGLEIVLNKWLGLSDDSNLNTDDYLIGPDYNRKLATGYALKIYGRCKQVVNVPTGKYQPIYEPISVYNIKNTINIAAPEIVKVNFPVLDITQILEDHGFRQALPKATFFRYSIVDDANWNIFQKPSKITKGYTYREALETVYYVDNSSIWNNKPLVWNGDRFI